MGARSPRSLIALQVLEQAVVQGKKVLPDPNSSCLPFLDCTALQFIAYDREKKCRFSMFSVCPIEVAPRNRALASGGSTFLVKRIILSGAEKSAWRCDAMGNRNNFFMATHTHLVRSNIQMQPEVGSEQQAG